jgi:hypothetical protein
VLDHVGEAVTTKNGLPLNGGLSGRLILAGQGNVRCDSIVDGTLGDFEALISPHGDVDVLPFGVGNRILLDKSLSLVSKSVPVRAAEGLYA